MGATESIVQAVAEGIALGRNEGLLWRGIGRRGPQKRD